MNYRHLFHAGNFADLVKHAALTRALSALQARGPVKVIDTHAGAGLYDLASAEARKTGEAAAGVERLLAADPRPAEFDALVAAVRRANGGKGETRTYPGSPWLVAQALRPQDAYVGYELRPDDHRALVRALQGFDNAQAVLGDGYRLAARGHRPRENALVLIDPPFERPDEETRMAGLVAALRRANPQAAALIWAPLKDLETFDRLVRALDAAAGAPLLVAETRLRPLADPMKMNGCALIVARPPEGLDAALDAAGRWVAETLGEKGEARLWRSR